MMRLVMEKGMPADAALDIPEGESVVGRSHSAQLKIEAGDVSGRHFRLWRNGPVVEVENLSQYGTYVDGDPVAGRRPLRHGQRLAIGHGTLLRFETDAEAAPAPAEVATGTTRPPPGTARGVPPHERPTGAGQSQTGAAPAAADAVGELTGGGDVAATGFAAEAGTRSAEGMTRAMQTRAASFEEIEFLRAQEQKRVKHRTWGAVLAVGGVLLLGVLFWPRTPPPEKVLEWPKDKNGDYLDAMLPGPFGGVKDGGYDLGFPGTRGWGKTDLPVANGKAFCVNTYIARDLSVPLRLTVWEDPDPAILRQDRRVSLQNKLEQLTKIGESWNFDSPSPVLFLGRENGIPALTVSYQREAKTGTWYGTIIYFRYGARQVTLMAEVPATERLRAEAFLNNKFLVVSRDYERGHWEGGTEPVRTAAAELVRQARTEMERNAPATWSKIEVLLKNAVRQATLDGNQENVKEAVVQLRRLRERQNDWFNGQKIAYLNARTLGRTAAAAAVAEQCKAVFSNDEDRRFFVVRRQDW